MESFDIKRYKTLLLETFKEFIGICNQNNLQYYCAGGTALGAVRHQGFIPWDDDIDVLMPRADYEKILSLNLENINKNFGVISARNTSIGATFAKFYNKNTTLWELKEIPFVYGIYIDIFPLDESSDNIDKFLIKYRKLRNIQRLYQLSQMSFIFEDIVGYYKKKDMKYFYKGLLSLFFPHFCANYLRTQLLKVEKMFMHQIGEHYVCPYGEYFAKEYFDKKWFDEGIELPFEGLMVKVPMQYDAYLKHVFGDYMKLPPKEKQVSHHYHYFLDMDKGMTLEEIKKVLANKKKES